jgi:hypothetical protein
MKRIFGDRVKRLQSVSEAFLGLPLQAQNEYVCVVAIFKPFGLKPAGKRNLIVSSAEREGTTLRFRPTC